MRNALLTLSAFVACLSLVGAEDAIPIQLERPFKSGDAYVVSGSAVSIQMQKVTSEGKDQESEATYRRMVFEGRVEVQAVTPEGNAEKATCTIEKCLLAEAEGQEPKETLPKGMKLIVTRSDAGVALSIDGGGEIPPAAHDLIELFLPVHDQRTDGNNDLIYGTTQPRKTGESWQIDTTRAAAALGKAMRGIPIDPAKIQGMTVVKGVEEAGGIRCAEILAELSVTDIPVGGPPNFQVVKGEVRATLSGRFPVDVALRPLDRKASMRFEGSFSGKGPDGKPVVIDTMFDQVQEVTYTPAK